MHAFASRYSGSLAIIRFTQYILLNRSRSLTSINRNQYKILFLPITILNAQFSVRQCTEMTRFILNCMLLDEDCICFLTLIAYYFREIIPFCPWLLFYRLIFMIIKMLSCFFMIYQNTNLFFHLKNTNFFCI